MSNYTNLLTVRRIIQLNSIHLFYFFDNCESITDDSIDSLRALVRLLR